MGRPKNDNPHPAPGYRDDDGASMSSAMSLNTTYTPEPSELDTDTEALPSYTDVTESYTDTPSTSDAHSTAPWPVDASYPTTTQRPRRRTQAPGDLDNKVEFWDIEDRKGSKYIRLSPTLTADPEALLIYLRWQSEQTPKAYIRIQGSHQELRRDSDGKNKRKERVEDFDFRAEVTDMYAREGRFESWHWVDTKGDTDKAYRGSRLKWRVKKARSPEEEEALRDSGPGLKEWCHLFCASGAPLKSFTLRNQIVGRNSKYMSEQIHAVIRETNYRGQIHVSFPLYHRSISVISPHTLNRLRHNNYVWWACVLLQLWVITWPLLFLLTKRWDVVTSKWSVTYQDSPDDPVLYHNESEESWVRRWKYTIQQSALSRLICPQRGQEITVPVDAREDRERRADEELQRRESETQSGFVGGALALARGLNNIRRESSHQLGWGYDC